MADVNVERAGDAEGNRMLAIVVYILYLIGWPTLHMATIVGLILAYVKRGDARGTVWESHFDNAIEVFWISLVAGIVGALTIFFGIGILILIALTIWFLFRTIKGLVRAIEGRAFV